MRSMFRSPSIIALTALILGLFLLAACGSSATATPQAAATTAPAATATPVPATAPPAMAKPSGTIQVGQKELGTFQGHPKFAVNPALFAQQTAPVSSGLFTIGLDREVQGWLVDSWSISDDFPTWTFKLHQGVQFHKGYGEMTAEDVIWSW